MCINVKFITTAANAVSVGLAVINEFIANQDAEIRLKYNNILSPASLEGNSCCINIDDSEVNVPLSQLEIMKSIVEILKSRDDIVSILIQDNTMTNGYIISYPGIDAMNQEVNAALEGQYYTIYRK